MSRWGRDEREQDGVAVGDGLSRSGGGHRPRPAEYQAPEIRFGANRREPVFFRERSLDIRPSERAAMAVLGRFRLIESKDLIEELYNGDRRLARADFEALRRQGLIRSATFRDTWGRHLHILTLTRDGFDFARLRAETNERLYWGFAKPAEVLHDSRFYRAFRHEERRLASEGYRVKGVVLEQELKSGYFKRLNAAGDSGPFRERQAEAARVVHLPVIDGHAVFPDFRIEYEDDRGDIARVDVEVTSDNYHDHHIATKVAAGFQVYGSAKTVAAAGRLGISSGSLGGGGFVEERSAVLLL